VISRRVLAGRAHDDVLNARRHRDGDQQRGVSDAPAVIMCSTPEGIETVISNVGENQDCCRMKGSSVSS
jgi:hypothetical protein